MAKIVKIWSREILDSRGLPTLETALQLDTGQVAVASVPAGVSTGMSEDLELRDKDPKRFQGSGVLKAIENVTKVLAPALIGMDPTHQFEIDQKMIQLDGSKNKSTLGANSILSVSLAVTKAGAIASGTTLYRWVYELAKAQKAVTEGIPSTLI